jgi:predicted DNA-binding transcriptional regulator AlpA
MKLLDHDGLKAKGIPYSRAQLWRRVRDRTFPAPIRVGGHRRAWLESEIDGWIAQLIRERDGVGETAA